MSKNKRLKMLAAALMVGSLYLTPGMQNPVMPVGMSSALAADGDITEKGQYIAIRATGESAQTRPDETERTYQDADGNDHNYILTTVKDDNGQVIKDDKGELKYWVREGYNIKVDENKRYDTASTSNVVSAYKGENADEAGLLQTTWIENRDSITTLNKKNLQNVNAGLYGASSNSGGVKSEATWDFFIKRDDKYVNVGHNNIYNNFKPATWNDKLQSYTYNGKVVSQKNLYVLSGYKGETVAGVFTTEENGDEIYTGSVYGLNNEILMTAVSNGKYYSYWGAEITDPTATIASMTVGQFNDTIGTINKNIEAVHGDNIKEIQVAKNDGNNGGTIGLQTNGSFEKDADGNLIAQGGANIPGTISITSSGGTKGEDMKVTFSNTDTKGQTQSFDVAVGSKVVANSKDAATGELSSVSINGQTYSITGGAISGTIDDKGNVSIQQGNKPAVTIGQVKDYVVSGGSINDNGTLTLNTANKYTGTTGENVTIEGIATKNDITNINNNIQEADKLNVKYDSEAKNSVTLGGGENGTQIHNVAAGTAGTDAVNLNQLNSVQTEAGKHSTVAAGTNVSNIETSTDATGGTKYTVNADGTTVSKGDDNLVVTKGNKDANNITDYSVKLADDLKVNSVTTNKMYVEDVDVTKNDSVTNVEYVTNQINNATETVKSAERHIAPTTQGKEYSVGDDGTVTMTYVDGNGKEVEGAQAVIKGVANNSLTNITNEGQNVIKNYAQDAVKVKAGNNTTVDVATDKENRSTTYTVNAEKTTVSGDKNVTVTPGETVDGVTNYSVKLNENVDGIQSVNGFDIVTGISGENNPNGMNINIHNDKDGITVNGVNIKQDTVSSLSNTTWDSNKDYSKSTNAATEAQLQQVSSVAQNANKGWYLSTNDGEKVNVKPEGVVDISNTDGNVAIKNDGTNVTVDLNDKVTLGNEDGINVAIDGTKGTLEVNGISSTTKIEGDRITVGKDVTIDGGSQPSISVGGIKADGYTDVVTGLSNTKWNNQIAGKVKADDTEQSKAATQGQLSSVWDKANEAGAEAAKHTTVTVNGGTEAEEGTYNADGNLQIKKTDNNGQTAYDVKLNDKVTLGNEDGINVAIDGTKGTLEVNGISSTTKIEGDRITVGKDVTIDGGSQPSISVGGIKADGYTDVVTGLSNTKWNNQIAGKVKADDTEQSKAATQGQLSSVWDKANEAGAEAAKHTTVTVNGGTEAEEGTYNADGNLQIKKTDNNGQTAYDVKLNDKVTLGNEDGINVAIDGTKGTLEVNGISSTTKIEGDRITVGKDVTIDGGSQPSISVGGIKADGYTDVVTGLSNTKWNNQIAGKVKADDTEQSKAATQGQLSSVWDKANEAGAEAAKHTTLSDGKNTTVSSTTVNGQTDYQVNLKDQITLGSSDNPGSITIAGADGKPITIANNLVIGLANVDWTEAVKNNVANSDEEKSKAATQGQLSDLNDYIDTLDEGNVKYNVNADGSIDYENITLGNIAYESETRSGGTHLNNVAYATGKDGSEAVNVDYLNDKIAESAGSGAVAENEKHIDTSKNYTVENNTVKLDEVNGQGNPTGNHVVIKDVASATDLADLKQNVGDLNYSTVEGTEIKDGDSTTTAIGKLDNKVDSLGDKVTNIEGNAITNGNITENGDINLKNDKGETQATVSGLTDSSLSSATYDASKGELTLTTKDKYGNDADKNFTVGNIASKDDIKNINTVTGADSKENLQEQYKDTNFIKDSENMVDADKKLDQAVSDNRDAIINNANNISSLDRRVSDLDSRVNKVGALAVAMAGLHPLGYDPTAPTEFSAAVGNYKGETALAIGVFHHPNEDVLLSVGASIAGDETAVNAGATFRFGRRGHNPQEEAERKAREEAKLAAQKAAQEEAYRKTMQYKIQKALTYQDNSEAVSESTTEAKDASSDTQEFPNVDLDAQNASSEANA